MSNKKTYLTREIIVAYNKLQEQLKELKETEMELRKNIVEECHQCLMKEGAIPKDTVKGKFTYTDPDGHFTIDFKMNTTSKLDEEAVEDDWDDLSEMERACFKVEKVYKLKAKESSVVLKLIENGTKTVCERDGREIELSLDKYISEKPAAPTIDINLEPF